jgi:hypothetical protein
MILQEWSGKAYALNREMRSVGDNPSSFESCADIPCNNGRFAGLDVIFDKNGFINPLSIPSTIIIKDP